jgi:hypothetical protein
MPGPSLPFLVGAFREHGFLCNSVKNLIADNGSEGDPYNNSSK